QDEEKVSAPGSVAKTTPKADSKADSKAAPDKKSDEKKTSEPPQKNAPEPAPKKNEGEKSKTPTPSTLPTPPSPARSAPLPDSATANKPKASASNPVAPAPAKPSAVPAPAPVKPSEPKAAPPTKIPAEVKPATKSGSSDEEDDDDESEDDVEQGPGRYIGDMQGDIEQVFNENKQQIPATSNPAVQVIGSANHGRLTNASDLLAYEKTHNPSGIHVIYPERKTYYGSTELIYLIAHLGVYTQELIPNYVLQISDLSHEKGGPLGHRSHQSGIDADIAFYFKDPAKQQKLVSALSGGKTGTPIESWMVEEQWKLFKYAVNSKYVDRIFIHPNLKKSLCELATKSGELKAAQKGDVVYETLRRLRPEKSHYNHFHLRVKCSKAQIRCLQMADPPPGTGC
ncbi:MAG TPA: penicillin-insensitive murein endopeptidase, partial [Bdellovibrio sp.]|nr:penicillin-insensitive murein endopeptidase [Bdellovibrio sp.]